MKRGRELELTSASVRMPLFENTQKRKVVSKKIPSSRGEIRNNLFPVQASSAKD